MNNIFSMYDRLISNFFSFKNLQIRYFSLNLTRENMK